MRSNPYRHARWNEATQRWDDDDDEVLRDGNSVRVPMMMRDSAERSQFEDACERLSSGKYTADDVKVVRAYIDQARAEAIREMCDAWKNPSSIADTRGQQEGDVCTIDGQPGHLRMINGRFECVPDERRDAYDAVEGQRIKDEAWRQMCLDLTSAWKSK